MELVQTKVGGAPIARRKNFQTQHLLFYAKLLCDQNELEESKLLYREVLKTDSWNLAALSGLIECIEKKKSVSEFARLELEKLHRLRLKVSKAAGHHLETAKFYIEEKEPKIAQKLLEKAALDVNLSDDCTFEVQRFLGNVYLQEGDLEHAEEAYHRAFVLNVRSPALLTNLGTLDIQKNSWALALERFQSAVEIDAGFDPAWVGLALCQRHLGDDQLAMGSLQKALDCAPSNQTAVHLFAHWCRERGRAQLALETVENYLDHVAQDLAISQLYIQLCCELRNYKKAMWETERCLLHDPTSPELLAIEDQLQKELALELA